MICAVSIACASVMVTAKLFQLFHPMGGVGARSGCFLAVSAVSVADFATNGAMAALARMPRLVMPRLVMPRLVMLAIVS